VSELGILFSFIPLSGLAFFRGEKPQAALLWCAVIVAVIANALLLYPHLQEPQWWLPYTTFLAVVLFDGAIKKKLKPLHIIAALFVGQALLTKDIASIIILLIFSDALFSAERISNLELESFLISLTSLLPTTIGVLLGLTDSELIYCVAASIVLRLSSWPFLNLAVYLEDNRDRFLTCMSLISIFVLWRTQSIQDSDLWAVIWMAMACILSIGARPVELLGFLSLGLFSISPVWGILGTSFWALSLYQGKNIYLLAILMAASGAFVAGDLPKTLIPEVAIALAALFGILFARTFVNLKEVKTNWVIEVVGVFIALTVGVSEFLLHPELEVSLDTASAVLSGSFVVFYVIGKILQKTKPRLFKPMKSMGRLALPRFKRVSARQSEVIEQAMSGKVTVISARFFNALDSEASIIVLLGILGLLLFGRLP